ncbi:type I restriction endonuclease subunit R [Candidatus Nitrosocaldus islandicus]|uniref:type I restriction endonuclease subunit R n=1 Tax=Candidatus Nitrosocaldus islandicus TaxID=2045011 RepID=UPI000CCFF5AD|nr:HsdR family type I site-specific deoxyribonuclease [Candidatus Nitrosocaldus islandicus]
MSLPVKEAEEVRALLKELEGLGWTDGGIRGFRSSVVEWSILFDRLREINSDVLEELRKRFGEEAFRGVLSELEGSVRDLLERAEDMHILRFLKLGISIRVRGVPVNVRLIDYEDIKRNSLCYAHEVEFQGWPENSRPDVVLYVNGIPLVVLEAKASLKPDALEEALGQLARYESNSPELFRFAQLAVAYVGRSDSVYRPALPNRQRASRSIPYTKWGVEGDGTRYDILDLLRPERLLKLIRWYAFFKGKDKKIVARYMQFWAAERAMERIRGYLEGVEGRNRALIWHWQGSGKTYTMFFIAHQFYQRYHERDPVVFFIVDRLELQRQLYEEFIADLDATGFENINVVSTIEELAGVLRGLAESEARGRAIKRGVYVVLVQKFQPERLAEIPQVRKKEVLVLVDEAHRSQYGVLAATMLRKLPNAVRVAFTGTPVFKFERNTFREFAYPDEGELYLHRYFVGDSIKDGYTVPLVYHVVAEAHGSQLNVSEEELRDIVSGWVREAEALGSLDELAEEAEEGEASYEPMITKQDIRRRLNRIRVFLENPERLKALARHIAKRIEGDTEGFRYKAMVVVASKLACVRMKRALDEALAERYGSSSRGWSEVVMTYSHNDPQEIQEFRRELLERWRSLGEAEEVNKLIQDSFKERDEPRVLIVTNMLITGFDFPRLRVMYLDKSLYEHRLLQAIARVNRPYRAEGGEKRFGLVVDSVGLLRHVREALLTFEAIGDREVAEDLGRSMLRDLGSMFQEFQEDLKNLKSMLRSGIRTRAGAVTIDIDELKEVFRGGEGALIEQREEELKRALNLLALSAPEPEVYRTLELMREVVRLYRALGSYPEKLDYVEDYNLVLGLYEYVWSRLRAGRIPDKRFWERLLAYVQERTEIPEFSLVKEATLDASSLDQASLEELRRRLESSMSEVAPEAFLSLRSVLELELANPVHRYLYERLKRLEEEWLVSRKLEVIAELARLSSEVEEYMRKAGELGPYERVLSDVRLAVRQRYGVEVRLERFSRELSALPLGPRLLHESEEKRLKVGLLEDLFRELKGVNTVEKSRLAEELMEYVRRSVGSWTGVR